MPAPLLEVRCCCQPQKLLGWLPLDGKPPVPGRRVTWTIRSAGWYWRVRRYVDAVPPGKGPIEFSTVHAQTLTLEIREWVDGAWDRGLAFSSEETPLETLRQVPGFVEAR